MTTATHGSGAALAIALVSSLAVPGQAAAQRLDLSVSPTIISFPPADPDVFPVVTSAPVTISYRIRQVQGKESWQLTVLSSGDLLAGGSSVDISNVSWVATPSPPFRSGTLSKTVAQVVASGNGNVNPTTSGSLTFRMANSWTYSTGTYTQTLVFTLSVP
jgi:hypothetical protein